MVNVFGRFMRERARLPALHRAGAHAHAVNMWAAVVTNFINNVVIESLPLFFISKVYGVPNHTYVRTRTRPAFYTNFKDDFDCIYTVIVLHAKSKIPF